MSETENGLLVPAQLFFWSCQTCSRPSGSGQDRVCNAGGIDAFHAPTDDFGRVGLSALFFFYSGARRPAIGSAIDHHQVRIGPGQEPHRLGGSGAPLPSRRPDRPRPPSRPGRPSARPRMHRSGGPRRRPILPGLDVLVGSVLTYLSLKIKH